MKRSPATLLMTSVEAIVSIVLVAILVLVFWEVTVWWWELPKALLPTPRACWAAAIRYRHDLLLGTLSTGAAAASGLVAATITGSLIGMVFSLSRQLRVALFPYVMLLQTIPIVAIIPLLIIWSGYTFRTFVVVTIVVSLFPIVNGATAGLTRVERSATDLFDLYHVGRWRRLIKLQIPSAVPDLMVGVKTSCGLSVISAIVAEFLVGSATSHDGLGTLIARWQGLLFTDALIAAVFASAMLGLTLFGIVHLISRLLLKRWS